MGWSARRRSIPTPWGAREGIVFDNAGEPGEVVTRAATYIAFDVTLHGSGGHPGKQLAGTASAIEMFRRAQYPVGALDGDTTPRLHRAHQGRHARATPCRASCASQGEVRTLLEGEARAELLASIERAFVEAAEELGGAAEVAFDAHCDGYEVAPDEPLLRAWAAALEARGEQLRTIDDLHRQRRQRPAPAHARLHRLHRRDGRAHDRGVDRARPTRRSGRDGGRAT